MLRVGQIVDGYEVVSHLSRGGQAQVFLGRAADTGEHVAIKVLEFADGGREWKAIRNFVDEATLSVGIAHPNVVRVYRLGEQDGDYYLVMEYLHGCPLSDLLTQMAKRSRGMLDSIAVYIAKEVAAGLHAAHELVDEDGRPLNVVHRDVSPQNIFLTVAGEVKLIDFGIAKARGRGTRTEKGMIKGKIRYLAPEQARGLALDRRTDIYALGIVFWEMLTMQPYVQGRDKAAIAQSVVNPVAIPPSRHAEHVSVEMDRLALHALQPSPKDRPATAADWIADVEVEASRDHVAELLRVFMRDTIVEAAKELPPALGEPLQKRAQMVSVLPGEDAATLRVTDEDRQQTLSQRPQSRPKPDTWAEVSLAELEELDIEIDIVSAGEIDPIDTAPTVRTSREAIDALRASLEARAKQRVKSSDPTMVLPRKSEPKSSNAKTMLILVAAFALGALAALAYVTFR